MLLLVYFPNYDKLICILPSVLHVERTVNLREAEKENRCK